MFVLKYILKDSIPFPPLMDSVTTTPPEQKAGPNIGQRLGNFFTDLYKVNSFILRFFKEAFVPPFELKEIVRQCYEIGVRSFTLITVTGFIVGLIFTKQSRPSLLQFGATSMLPSLVQLPYSGHWRRWLPPLLLRARLAQALGPSLAPCG